VAGAAWPNASRLLQVLAATVVSVAIVAWIAYGAMIGDNFVFDDWQHLEHVAQSAPLAYLTSTLDVRQPHYFYRPVPRLLMYAQYMVFGGRAGGYHITSLLLHIANSILWGLLLWQVTRRLPMLPLAALLYAVFPVYADAVFWISDTEILLAVFFGLLCLLLWARFVISASRGAGAGALLCLALALLSKEAAVFVVPMMAVLHALSPRLFPGAGGRRRVSLWAYMPVVLIVAGYLILDVVVVARDVPLLGSSYSVGTHLLTNAGRYLSLLATPLHGWASGAAGWLRLLVAGALVVWLWSKDWPRTLFLLLWIGCALLPYIAFNDGVTQRYVYAAALGWTGLVAFALCLLWQWRGARAWLGRGLAVGACILVLVVCAGDVRSRQMMFAASTHTQENVLYHVQALHPSLPQGSALYFLNAPVAGRYLAAMFNVVYGGKVHASAVDESKLPAATSSAPTYVFRYRNGALEELVYPAQSTASALTVSPALPVSFGPAMGLVGCDVPDAAVQPGGQLLVLLYWQARGPANRSYTAYVHLVDANWTMWAQADSIPQAGAAPTNGWQKGQFVGDYYLLTVPAAVPRGRYRLEVGVYDATTMQRLPVMDDKGSVIDDRVMIEPVVVQ
jgi:hypothetical protein